MQKDCIIYRAVFPNGKIYIGQTVSAFRIRRAAHLRAAAKGEKTPFHCAIRKYGEPQWAILCRACSVSVANALERAYISLYGAFGAGGYNANEGGANARLSACTRALLSAVRRGRKQSAAHVEARAAACRGQKRTAAQRARVSAARKGFRHSAETKKRIGDKLRGVPKRRVDAVVETTAN